MVYSRDCVTDGVISMDKHRGFLQHPREESDKEKVYTRVQHWHEYEHCMPAARLVRQAGRCMDCGTPCCHHHCPVHNLIPDWHALVSEEHWQQAYEGLDTTNNFPEFTGRLCPAPCEDACTLKLADAPVTIRSIELAVIERAWSSGWVRPQRAVQSISARVAIIGSGPAGLACAQQLARAGYQVTVYEKADRAGGLLRYGIPDFRLEKSVVDRRLAQLVDEGVEIKTGVRVGADLPVNALECDALVLACGSEQPRDISVPGRALGGIHFAKDILTQQNHRVAGDRVGAEGAIVAKGRDVVVIGGGDTGADCVGTAFRQEARSVTQIQYHDRPPTHADILNYWPEPAPEFHKNDHDEEGLVRIWGWDTIAFGGEAGKVKDVALQRLTWSKDAGGAWKKKLVTDETQRQRAQLVLLAMGYAHPEHDGPVAELALDLDDRGDVAASDKDYKTSSPGVFTCGDMRRGQSLVVWAIHEGRACAHAVDDWLSGESHMPD